MSSINGARKTESICRRMKLDPYYSPYAKTKSNKHLAGHSGSRLYSQHFGKLRWVDHIRSGFQEQSGQKVKPVSTENTNISWGFWHAPIIPGIWEAEAWELLELKRRRLQWSEIAPLHSSLGNRARLHFKQRKKERERGWEGKRGEKGRGGEKHPIQNFIPS